MSPYALELIRRSLYQGNYTPDFDHYFLCCQFPYTATSRLLAM